MPAHRSYEPTEGRYRRACVPHRARWRAKCCFRHGDQSLPVLPRPVRPRQSQQHSRGSRVPNLRARHARLYVVCVRHVAQPAPCYPTHGPWRAGRSRSEAPSGRSGDVWRLSLRNASAGAFGELLDGSYEVVAHRVLERSAHREHLDPCPRSVSVRSALVRLPRSITTIVSGPIVVRAFVGRARCTPAAGRRRRLGSPMTSRPRCHS